MKQLNYHHWVDGPIVAIEDLHGADSVTAHAEVVLMEVEKEIGSLAGKFVIWRDNESIWDGLMCKDGRVSLYPIGVYNFEEAKQKILKLAASQPGGYQFGSDPIGDARQNII